MVKARYLLLVATFLISNSGTVYCKQTFIEKTKRSIKRITTTIEKSGRRINKKLKKKIKTPERSLRALKKYSDKHLKRAEDNWKRFIRKEVSTLRKSIGSKYRKNKHLILPAVALVAVLYFGDLNLATMALSDIGVVAAPNGAGFGISVKKPKLKRKKNGKDTEVKGDIVVSGGVGSALPGGVLLFLDLMKVMGYSDDYRQEIEKYSFDYRIAQLSLKDGERKKFNIYYDSNNRYAGIKNAGKKPDGNLHLAKPSNNIPFSTIEIVGGGSSAKEDYTLKEKLSFASNVYYSVPKKDRKTKWSTVKSEITKKHKSRAK